MKKNLTIINKVYITKLRLIYKYYVMKNYLENHDLLFFYSYGYNLNNRKSLKILLKKYTLKKYTLKKKITLNLFKSNNYKNNNIMNLINNNIEIITSNNNLNLNNNIILQELLNIKGISLISVLNNKIILRPSEYIYLSYNSELLYKKLLIVYKNCFINFINFYIISLLNINNRLV
jgi:hypothetical protein